MFPSSLRLSFFGFAACSILSVQGLAQGSATTDPVGFYTITCSGSSDTIMSIPFTEPAEYVGLINSTSSNGVVTVSGSAGWTANQFVYGSTPTQKKHYYALIGTKLSPLTGTLSMTGSSTAITGSGTAFNTAVAVNDGLLVGQSYFVVKAVNSATSLTTTLPARLTANGTSGYVSKSPKEGSIYDITANNGAATYSLTLDLNGDDLSAVQAGTQVSVIPYPTLASLLPPADQGVSFIVTTDTANLKTELRIPDSSAAGINAPNARSYFFFNGAWRQQGQDLAVDHGDDTILPGTFFRFRNNDATTTNLTLVGSVPSKKKLTLPVATQGAAQQDNYLSIIRPLDVTLNQSGLLESGAFTASTSAMRRGDELYVFDNSRQAINKAPSATYFHLNNAWRKLGQAITIDAGNDVIPAGSGFLLRKAAVNGGPTKFWENAQTFE